MYSFFFFKQKTAYEMRISDWSSDVCSSYLASPWPVRQAPTGSLRTPTAGSASPRHCRRDTAAARAPAITGTGAWSSDTRPVLRRPFPGRLGRSAAERRGGQECVSECRYRWSTSSRKKKIHNKTKIINDLMIYYVFFFFFQAEDGIRDAH